MHNILIKSIYFNILYIKTKRPCKNATWCFFALLIFLLFNLDSYDMFWLEYMLKTEQTLMNVFHIKLAAWVDC